MDRTVRAKDRQDLYDIALTACGDADAAFEIARLSGMGVTDVPEDGLELRVPEEEEKKVTEHYAAYGVDPATGPPSSHSAGGGGQPGGGGSHGGGGGGGTSWWEPPFYADWYPDDMWRPNMGGYDPWNDGGINYMGIEVDFIVS